MPITVSCSCGKIFKVKDEVAGTTVKCQVCGKEVLAPQLSAQESPPPVIKESASPVVTPVSSESITCPGCAESIPRVSRKCPLCGEAIKHKLTREEQNALIQDRIANLDAHLSDLNAVANDDAVRSKLYSVKTYVVGAFAALGLLLFIAGIFMRDGAGVSVIGFLIGVPFGIGAIVSFINDKNASQISDSPTADVALRRFLMAVRTGRSNKAYVALSPIARQAGAVESIKFHNPKIATHDKRFSIRDPKSFKEYWASIFTAPSSASRSVAIKKVQLSRGRTNDVAFAEAQLDITSYPSWVIVTVLFNLIICLILILAIEQKETKIVRKMLIRRNGKWYFAEGELEGPLDKLQLD